MLNDLTEFDLEPYEDHDGAVLFAVSVQPVLLQRVIEAQLEDDEAR